MLYPVFGMLKSSDSMEVYRGLGRNQAERKAKLHLYHKAFRNNN